jgi:PAS domain S-box-containing protein
LHLQIGRESQYTQLVGDRVNTAQLLTDIIFLSLYIELEGRGQERGTPMTQSRPNEPFEQESASTQAPGDPQTSEFRIGRVIDAIPGFVWSASPNGDVEFFSQRWLDYTGKSLDEVRGEELATAIHPQDKPDFVEKWRAAITQGESFEAAARVRRADGFYRWFLVRAVPLRETGRGISRWYGINLDIEDLKRAQEEITERKRAEERLLESEARFQVMADTAPVLIWMTGTDGLCNYFNKPWLEFTGRSMEQEVGTGWTEGVHPDDLQGCFDGFLPAFHARKPFRMEYRLRRADGEYRWVIESGIPRYTGDGEFAGYIGSNIDITDLKRAEQERERLRQAQADLARVSRVTIMGELTASLAHEVNQPIAAAVTSANSCLHWLAADVPNLDKARAAAMRIVKDGTRVAEIISRIRLLFQKGSQPLELVNVNDVIEEMIVLLRGEIKRCSISVRTELAADILPLMADRVQLQQVMMNLMTNSIDAMKAVDGTRELAIKSQRGGNEQLLVSVSDTGVGLPPERADQIFNAFFTTKPHGTGMGLRISRSIIESHGGRLSAAENSPRGATFQFSLPVERALTATA